MRDIANTIILVLIVSLFFGVVPLLTYIWFSDIWLGFGISVLAVIVGLMLGALKSDEQ